MSETPRNEQVGKVRESQGRALMQSEDLYPRTGLPERGGRYADAGNAYDPELDQFISEQQEARQRGETLLYNDDGTPYQEEGEMLSLAPQVQQEADRLARSSIAAPTDNTWARDKAFTELTLSTYTPVGQDRGLEERAAEIEQGGGIGPDNLPESPSDYVAHFTHKMVQAHLLEPYLDLSNIGHLPPEEQASKTEHALEYLPYTEATREVVVAIVMSMDPQYANATGEDVREIAKSIDMETVTKMRNQLIAAQRARLLEMRDTFLADNATADPVQKGLQFTFTELIPPIWAISKQGPLNSFLSNLSDTLNMPVAELEDYFLLGEGQYTVGKLMQQVTPSQREAIFRTWVQTVKDYRNKPVIGPLLSRYAVLAQTEDMFSDAVLTGDGNPAWMRWLLNFESAAEIFSAAWSVGRQAVKLGKAHSEALTVKETLRGRQTQAGSAAAAAGNYGRVTDIDRVLLSQAEDARLESVQAAKQMPRPLGMELDVSLPGHGPQIDYPGGQAVADVARNADNIEPRILSRQAGYLNRILTPENKTNVVNNQLEKMARTTLIGERVVAVPGMSQIEQVADGVEMRVVLAQDGRHPWDNVPDLLVDLEDLDDTFEMYSILRVANDGNIEQMDMPPASLKRMASTRYRMLSDNELLEQARKADPESLEWNVIEREAARRQGDVLDPHAYFLQRAEFRPWHPTDKILFGEQAFRNSVVPRAALSPNAKFGDEIVGAFQDNYLDGQSSRMLFEGMFKPYYKLSSASKRNVGNMLEWEEDIIREGGKPQTIFEFYAAFPDATNKELAGLTALKRGHDAQFEVFNRRMYLDYQGLGYKTGRPVDPMLPNYHGDVLEVDNIKPNSFYNPVTQMQETLTRKELAAFYARGGRVMKLDIAIDAGPRAKAQHILMDPDYYKVGELSTAPLEYFPNYTFKFHTDPYYIVKVNDGVLTDGIDLTRGGSRPASTEAIYTAGSELKATAFLNRIANLDPKATDGARWVNKDGDVFQITRAHELAQEDNVLAQKQALYRTNRMFWDKRGHEGLKSVDGGRAPVLDLTRAIDRGVQLAAKQNSQEDGIRALREALQTEYAKSAGLVDDDLRVLPMKSAIKKMEDYKVNVIDAAHKKRIEEAIEVAKYIRTMEGYTAGAISKFRAMALSMATWVERVTKGRLAGRRTQDWAMTTNPIRSAVSTAFHAFMVLFPGRQLFLQASQPMMLAGIDFKYVASGLGLWDAIATRIGFTRLVNSSFDPGYSNKALAGMMRLSKKEYNVLMHKLEESGSLSVIDSHGFAAATSTFNKLEPSSGTLASTARLAGETLVKQPLAAARWGFDTGESINKVGSFNIAWRRVMRENKYKSLLELTDEDWKKVKMDTENLSLAMTKINSFPYQHGMWQATTQFLAFSHKVLLTALGQNPALTTKETAKMWAGMIALFGANTVGMRDEAQDYLRQIGAYEYAENKIDHPAFPAGTTLLDVISAGMYQTVYEKIATWTDADHQKLDTEAFTPIMNITQFNEMILDGLLEADASILFGPIGNRVTGVMRAYTDATALIAGRPEMDPSDELMLLSTFMLSGAFPQFNHIATAVLSDRAGYLVNLAGDNLGIQATKSTLIAKGLLGARTREEMQQYRTAGQIFKSDEMVRELSKQISRTLDQNYILYHDGKLSVKAYEEALFIAATLADGAPPGRRMEVMNKAMHLPVDPENPESSFYHKLLSDIGDGKLQIGQAKSAIVNANLPPEIEQNMLDFVDSMLDSRQLSDKEQLDYIRQGSM